MAFGKKGSQRTVNVELIAPGEFAPSSPPEIDRNEPVGHFSEILSRLERFSHRLDGGEQKRLGDTVSTIGAYLLAVRSELGNGEWRSLIEAVRKRGVLSNLLDDPFTRRSFEKPDGYPGDARLLDFIYGAGQYRRDLSAATALGRSLYLRNRMALACKAVRNRSDMIAEEIGDILATANAPRILSVACGHLRELDRIDVSSADNLELFCGFDQDARSIKEIDNACHHPNLVTVVENVSSIIRNKFAYRDFDLIYSLGLFDYLDTRFAVRLTRKLFELLGRGGKLVIANFHQDTGEKGYMEMFMDWFLEYRSEQDMYNLLREVDLTDLSHVEVVFEPAGQVMLLRVVRT
ncbi:MAG: hypothetical protein GY798_01555 [Hyphomicrobiales bacterium]|nr:hypothetical protein [Hyphomicrobiales bacterium]